MSEPIVYGREVRRYGWRARLAHWLMTFGCRHMKGTVCSHRQFEYDINLSGYHHGWISGESHERRDWVTASPELRSSWIVQGLHENLAQSAALGTDASEGEA